MTNLVDSGIYTPTLTDTTNVASSTAFESFWSRIDDVVTVEGKITVDPTDPSSVTLVELSLPIESNFTAATNAGGGGFASSIGYYGSISANVTNDTADFDFISDAGAGSTDFQYMFTYRIM